MNVIAPTKIVCVGRNYAAHAAEMASDVPPRPLIFLKPPSAVIGPEDSIVLPAASGHVDHEAEIGLVVARRCRHVPAEHALDVIGGVTCVNDVTARDLQKTDGQWTRGKGFDTFCPAGPQVVPLDACPSGDALEVVCRVNGDERQRSHAGLMVFDFAAIVAYVSGIMTLEPGDLIATGTPSGVGPLADGDVVEVEVSGVGILRNPVVADA
jgi:2-keto-4-pentenoate hydratase/2-oxohepta-3-ene-1,7-dioic acid hydratase in catechol pathway